MADTLPKGDQSSVKFQKFLLTVDTLANTNSQH